MAAATRLRVMAHHARQIIIVYRQHMARMATAMAAAYVWRAK